MIRPATLSDVNAILDIAQRDVRINYPLLRCDVNKIRRVLVESISSAKHFCWVSSEDDGSVTGAIVGLVQENFWAQRQCCNIALWAAQVCGDGVRLLNELKKWVTSRRAIRVVGFTPDSEAIDLRVWRLAERMGFKRHGGAYLFYN